jgi:hypothetical protein
MVQLAIRGGQRQCCGQRRAAVSLQQFVERNVLGVHFSPLDRLDRHIPRLYL